MPSNPDYVSVEIRILERQDKGYPVEITLGNEQEFPQCHRVPAPCGKTTADPP